MEIWSILKASWNQFRENFLKFLLFNLVWFAFISFLFFIGYRGFLTDEYYMLIFPLLLYGPLFIVGLEVVVQQKFSFKAIISYFKRSFLRGFITFLFVVAAYGILFYDLYFILNKIGDSGWYLIFPVIVFYIIIMFTMYQICLWGLLVLKRKKGIISLCRQAYSLTFKNLLFSFFWTILILILSVSLVISRIGFPLFFMAFTGLLISNGTKHLIDKIETGGN